MASRRVTFSKVKEEKIVSIAQYNVDNNTQYYLFDPYNVTDFKCHQGIKAGNLVYIHEFLSCMWGNDEIDEYVLLSQDLIDSIHLEDYGEVRTAKYSDIEIKYAFKRGLFSRYLYNVLFTKNNTTYYIYLKTINGVKFKQIIEDFITSKYNQY